MNEWIRNPAELYIVKHYAFNFLPDSFWSLSVWTVCIRMFLWITDTWCLFFFQSCRMSKIRRKVTVENSKTISDSSSSSSTTTSSTSNPAAPSRRPSVFERLGPSTGSNAADVCDTMKYWNNYVGYLSLLFCAWFLLSDKVICWEMLGLSLFCEVASYKGGGGVMSRCCTWTFYMQSTLFSHIFSEIILLF